jgi:predicted Zn-ribbon and HTH transcriptional regulator
MSEGELTPLQQQWAAYMYRMEKLEKERRARSNQRHLWHERPCADCGVVMMLHKRYPRCPECKRKRHLEAMRKAQARRRLSALRDKGLTVGTGAFDILTFARRKPQKCPCCGVRFVPKRTGHKFCSTRCRVTHHRRAVSV